MQPFVVSVSNLLVPNECIACQSDDACSRFSKAYIDVIDPFLGEYRLARDLRVAGVIKSSTLSDERLAALR